jgi:hypothetical protein
MNDKLSSGHKVGGSGAALVLVAFFLPWILVSCNGQPVAELSGWQLAVGTTVGDGFGAQSIPGRPIFFLVALSAIAVLGLTYLAWQRGTLIPLDGFGLIGLGIAPLLILMYQFGDSQSEAAQQGFDLDFKYGLIGVVLGFLAVVIGGIMNMKADKSPGAE